MNENNKDVSFEEYLSYFVYKLINKRKIFLTAFMMVAIPIIVIILMTYLYKLEIDLTKNVSLLIILFLTILVVIYTLYKEILLNVTRDIYITLDGCINDKKTFNGIKGFKKIYFNYNSMELIKEKYSIDILNKSIEK